MQQPPTHPPPYNPNPLLPHPPPPLPPHDSPPVRRHCFLDWMSRSNPSNRLFSTMSRTVLTGAIRYANSMHTDPGPSVCLVLRPLVVTQPGYRLIHFGTCVESIYQIAVEVPCFFFVCWLAALRPTNLLVYFRDGSAQTSVIITIMIIAFKGAIADFILFSSLRREPSPTNTLKWPGCNRVQITCNH